MTKRYKERIETILVDLPTVRPHQLSMTKMRGRNLLIVPIRTFAEREDAQELQRSCTARGKGLRAGPPLAASVANCRPLHRHQDLRRCPPARVLDILSSEPLFPS